MRDFDKEIDALERKLRFVRQEKEKETFRRDSVQQASNALSTILNQNPLLICPDLPSFPVHERSVYTFGFPRGFGKTTFLLNRLRKNATKFYSIVIVPTFQEAERIVREEVWIDWSRCLVSTRFLDIRQLVIREPIGEILIDEYQEVDEEFIRLLVGYVNIHNTKFDSDISLKIIRIGTPRL